MVVLLLPGTLVKQRHLGTNMASEKISEHLIWEIFLGEHAPRPTFMVALLISSTCLLLPLHNMPHYPRPCITEPGWLKKSLTAILNLSYLLDPGQHAPLLVVYEAHGRHTSF